MRTTTVPAQITTVEDKIAGELSITQLFLLVAPIFGGAAIFVLLPPFFSSATYKIVVITCLAAIFGTLAVRLKGKIVLLWATILVRYNARARYFLFDKNDTYMRYIPTPEADQKIAQVAEPEVATRKALPRLSAAELIRIERLITNPQAKLHFTANRKGELHVHVTEV
jgi:hypothetical protein